MRARPFIGMTLALSAAVMTGTWAQVSRPSPLPVVPARQTIKDLKSAYQSETAAREKYAAYALQAREEGYRDVAALFRAASEAERIHARNYRAVLLKLGVSEAPGAEAGFYRRTPGLTAENLWDALTAESLERNYIYPEMIKRAASEGQREAVRCFTYALHAETQHVALYRWTLENLTASPRTIVYYVAPGCGATYANVPPPVCPLCGAPATRFERFE
jgi:rubrerythrin